MILKDAECFELVIREVRDAKLIANALLIEGYDVQITPIMSAISSTNTGLSRKYIVTVRQGLNRVVTTT
jgi:hypothetical protein